MEKGHPHEEGRKRDSSEQIHHPEFIIIDEESAEKERIQGRREEGSFSSFEDLTDVKFPFSIRVVSFGLSLLMLMSAIAAVLGIIGAGLISVLTLGYYERSIALFHRCVNWWRKSSVLALGFFIAIFSPSFGFTIIIIYFLMLGEKISHDILKKMLYSATKY